MSIFNHDLHIHSQLSSCSRHPEQTADNILAYAKKHNLNTICITDHFWDETIPGASKWYMPQNFEHISRIKPLPEADGIRFLFGCETDMDKYGTIGVSKERAEKEFDFIIVPTTHMHMDGFTVRGDEEAEERAQLWAKRFDTLLESDLPLEKMGVAHLTCTLLWRGRYLEVIEKISDEDMIRLFRKAAGRGLGIELNFDALALNEKSEPIMLRPYRIAMEEGCKFYFGSDAHKPEEFVNAPASFERMIELLGLEEKDMFVI